MGDTRVLWVWRFVQYATTSIFTYTHYGLLIYNIITQRCCFGGSFLCTLQLFWLLHIICVYTCAIYHAFMASWVFHYTTTPCKFYPTQDSVPTKTPGTQCPNLSPTSYMCFGFCAGLPETKTRLPLQDGFFVTGCVLWLPYWGKWIGKGFNSCINSFILTSTLSPKSLAPTK